MPSHGAGISLPREQRSHQTSIAVLCVLLALGCSILCPPAHTQTAGTGTLSGNITDPSGAAASDVQVKVAGETTGETRTVSSPANGSYFVAPRIMQFALKFSF
jgi:hypothetical protein